MNEVAKTEKELKQNFTENNMFKNKKKEVCWTL